MRITIKNLLRIKKSSLDTKTLEFIRESLTFDNPDYKGAQKSGADTRFLDKHLFAYTEADKYVFMTRGFLSLFTSYLKDKKIKYKIDDKTTTAKADFDLKMPNSIILHPYQKRAGRVALREHRGVIKMPCGTGKTINLINIITELKQKTLVVVNTEFIRDQWIDYFKDLFNYDVGIVQGQNYDIQDVTVAMIPTLAQGKTPPDFYDMWGCVVIDECHHAPMQTLNEVIKKISSKYMFGTTATAKRTDGLDNLIFALLGNIIYSVSASNLSKQGYVNIPKLRRIHTGFISESRAYNKLIPRLINDTNRNQLICDNLLSRRENYNIVISNRIEHLENIIEIYSQYTDDYELVIGKVKKEERVRIVNEMREGRLHTIFATQLADEGLDIPILDTLHSVFPTKAEGVVEQRVGRIQRVKETTPLVIDYIDSMVSKFAEFYTYRERLYRRMEIELEEKENIKGDKKKSKNKRGNNRKGGSTKK